MPKTLSTDKNIAVLYHADCADGFGAAWAAWNKFGDSADYIPVAYGDEFPEGLSDKEVYFLDFCYDDPNVVTELSKITKKLILIDHHKSQEQTVRSVPGSVFDPRSSGAVLAWNYFHPGIEVPMMLKLIEDRDLWKFTLPNTIEIDTAMDAMPREFSTWTHISDELQTEIGRKDYTEKGKLVLSYQQKIMDLIIKNNSQRILFEGREIYAVNAPHWFADIIADELYKKLPPMALVWTQLSDMNAFSLRSNGSIDVSEIAKKFGGGGHQGSAGFKMPLGTPLPWKVINE